MGKLLVYTDIDEMPIYNWFKVHNTGDYSYVLVKKRKVFKTELKQLDAAWRNLYDQYINEFGFSDSFLSILEKKQEIALLQIEKAETGDAIYNTLIKLKQAELQRKEADQEKGMSFYEIKAHAEKKIGFQIDIRKMSVLEFYTTLKTIENAK